MKTYKKDDVCPSCTVMVADGTIPREQMMPMRGGAFDGIAKSRPQYVCVDCRMADTIMALSGTSMSYSMARKAVAMDRAETFRRPCATVSVNFLGLQMGFPERRLREHLDWLDGLED